MFKQLTVLGVLLIVGACGPGNDVVTDSAGFADTIEDSGAITRDEWREYGPFQVHDGGEFRATLSMTGGDADLYVSVDRAPSLNDVDCRPYLGGAQTEECEVAGPAMVYVAVSGYGWRTDFELKLENSSTPPPPPPTAVCGNDIVEEGEVCDGTIIACYDLDPTLAYGDVPCLSDCSGWDEAACTPSHSEHTSGSGTITAGRWRHLGPFNASDGAFTAVLSGTSDADLYVRRGAPATADNYACRSNGVDSNERCSLAGEGLYYVSILGYAASSDYVIDVDYSTTYGTERVRVNERSSNVAADEWMYFGPYYHGAGLVHVLLSGTNDADLYVKHGSKPTETSWDCRPYGNSSEEFCNLGVMSSGELWVGVRGYSTSAEFDMMAVWVMD